MPMKHIWAHGQPVQAHMLDVYYRGNYYLNLYRDQLPLNNYPKHMGALTCQAGIPSYLAVHRSP